MTYLYLSIAIVAEIVATTFLKLSDSFTKPVPAVATVLGYAIAFYFLSLTLRVLPTGIAYAIWSGVGVVVISLVGWLYMGQALNTPTVIGLALIVAGVVVVNLYSPVQH
jgi:small multidrug resistance pump